MDVERVYLDAKEKRQVEQYVVDTDEGPRASTLEGSGEVETGLRRENTVTAGSSSQTSDGAAFVLVVSERMLKQLGVQIDAPPPLPPWQGVEPRIMRSIGPGGGGAEGAGEGRAEAGRHRAVRAERGLRITITGGGAGAGHQPGDREREQRSHWHFGHPLAVRAQKLTVQLLNEMRRRKQKYGVVTMCVGTGQGQLQSLNS